MVGDGDVLQAAGLGGGNHFLDARHLLYNDAPTLDRLGLSNPIQDLFNGVFAENAHHKRSRTLVKGIFGPFRIPSETIKKCGFDIVLVLRIDRFRLLGRLRYIR